MFKKQLALAASFFVAFSVNLQAATLTGTSSADVLTGTTDVDTISGLSGIDTFTGTPTELNGDTITDLEAGEVIKLKGVDLTSYGYLNWRRFGFYADPQTLSIQTDPYSYNIYDLNISLPENISHSLKIASVVKNGSDTDITFDTISLNDVTDINNTLLTWETVGVEFASLGTAKANIAGDSIYTGIYGTSVDVLDRIKFTLNAGATFADANYSLEEVAGGAGTGNLMFSKQLDDTPEGNDTIIFEIKSQFSPGNWWDTGDYGVLLSGSNIAGQSINFNLPIAAAGTEINITTEYIESNNIESYSRGTATLKLFEYVEQFPDAVTAPADAIIDYNNGALSFVGGSTTDTIGFDFNNSSIVNRINVTDDDNITITLSGNMTGIDQLTLWLDSIDMGNFTIDAPNNKATIDVNATKVFNATESHIELSVGSAALYSRAFTMDAQLDFADTKPNVYIMEPGTSAGSWGTNNAAPSSMSLDGQDSDSINENNSVGDAIGTLTAIDSDTDSSDLIFSLVTSGCTGNGAENANFTITGNTLKANVAFDYETQTSYKACVNVTDGDNNYTKEFVVSINNVDESTDAQCGSDHNGVFITTPTNLCSVGQASQVAETHAQYTWSCSGTDVGNDNGTDVNCSATHDSDADGDQIPDSTEGPNEVFLTFTNNTTAGGTTNVSFAYESTTGGSNPTAVASTLSVTKTTTPGTPPADVNDSLLFGAVEIVATSDTAGFTQTITFTIPADANMVFTGLWKHGPNPESAGATEWYDLGTLSGNANIAGREGTGYVISNGGKTLTLYLVDGLRGDDDYNLGANGTIIDAAVPLVGAPVSVPLFGPFGYLLLSALMGFFGYRRLKA